MSLSAENGPDEYVLLMMAGTNNMREDKGQTRWDDVFVKNLKKYMKVTVKGDGTKHHGSVGKFRGFGCIAKFSK